jgi:hypothetical protein
MSTSRSRPSPNDTQHSDALADIALNTLGLVLIVMLIYILMFRQTTQKIAHAAQASESRLLDLEEVATENADLKKQLAMTDTDYIESLQQEIKGLRSTVTKHAGEIADRESQVADLNSRLDQEEAQRINLNSRLKEATDLLAVVTTEKNEFSERNAKLERELAESEKSRASESEAARRLQGDIRELEDRIGTLAKESRISGLWRFRNNVVELVDHNDATESVDWTIDYFLYLNVVDGKVSGTLFGAHEIETADNKGNSQSFAEITGTVDKSGFLDVELVFSQGTTDAGSEHLRCRFVGNEFVGRLESGRHRIGYRNYVGPTRGTRLTESVFK